MEKYFRHVDMFNKLLSKDNNEVTFSTHATIVKMENEQGKSLLGILLDKSIAIPLSFNSETDDKVKTLVQTNLLELSSLVAESTPQAACRLLNLPFNGKTHGFFSDGGSMGNETINTIHIYPDSKLDSQDDFLTRLNAVFELRGIKFRIENQD
jgi:hypothetical protein